MMDPDETLRRAGFTPISGGTYVRDTPSIVFGEPVTGGQPFIPPPPRGWRARRRQRRRDIQALRDAAAMLGVTIRDNRRWWQR